MLQCKKEQYCISTKIGWICWGMHWHVSNKILLCRHKTLLTSISQVIMLYYLPIILRAVSGFDIYSLLPTCNMFEIVGVLLCLTKCHVIIKLFFLYFYKKHHDIVKIPELHLKIVEIPWNCLMYVSSSRWKRFGGW